MNPNVLSAELFDAGLVLQGAIPLDELDDATIDALSQADIDHSSHRVLLLFAQAGRSFWSNAVVDHLDLADPFDDRAHALVTSWFDAHHPDARWDAVYPGPAPLPLGRLAEQVGWGSASPLGLTINPIFGLWLAHRIVVVSDLEIAATAPDREPEPTDHPCETCVDTPCVSACPVDAVSLTSGYDVETCARHRISVDTDCALQCLARNACPVGADHRYGPTQMAHHYGAGLRSIWAWLGTDADH